MTLVLLTLLVALIALTRATTPPAPPATAIALALAGPSPSTMLFAATPTLDPNATVHALNDPIPSHPTQTITQTARIKQTSLPTLAEPLLLFPFHLALSTPSENENTCAPDQKSATAVFQNGDWITRIVNLTAGSAAAVQHRIPGFPAALRVGPFDARAGEVRFAYGEGGEWGCAWGDGDEEGEGAGCGCRTGGWEDAGEGGKTKEMNCSFVLGWKHDFRAPAA